MAPRGEKSSGASEHAAGNIEMLARGTRSSGASEHTARSTGCSSTTMHIEFCKAIIGDAISCSGAAEHTS